MQCGTKPDMNGKFYENNIVIQYDKDLIEVGQCQHDVNTVCI